LSGVSFRLPPNVPMAVRTLAITHNSKRSYVNLA
jgi:hypothetical protein